MPRVKRKTFKRKPKSTFNTRKHTRKFTSKKKFVPRKKSRFTTKLNVKPIKTGTGHWLHIGKLIPSTRRNTSFIKNMERLLMPQKLLVSTSTQVAPGTGLQNSAIVGSIYNITDINAIFAALTGGQNKVIFKSQCTKILITNQTNAPSFVTLYSIMNRRDVPTADTNYADPYQAWLHGSAVGGVTNLGTVPFDSQEFTTLYNVKRITRLNLALGETAEYFYQSEPQKVFDSYLRAGAIVGFKGLTGWIMATVHGCAADSANATVGLTTSVCDFIATTHYTFEQVTSQGPTTTTTLDTIQGATQIMNTGTGTSVAVASA